MAFHRREGFFVERLELSLAQLTAVQINKAKGKGSKKISPVELMPYHDIWRRERNLVDPEFHDDQIKRELASIGVRIVKGERKNK